MSVAVKLSLIQKEEKERLVTLFKDYAREFMVMSKGDLSIDENSSESHLSKYWEGENRTPYFIQTKSDLLVGFVLVNDYCVVEASTPKFAVAEFYILPEFRAAGFGKDASGQVFDLHRGRWEIRVMRFNAGALVFWRKVVAEYTNGDFAELKLDDARLKGTVFLFRNGDSI